MENNMEGEDKKGIKDCDIKGSNNQIISSEESYSSEEVDSSTEYSSNSSGSRSSSSSGESDSEISKASTSFTNSSPTDTTHSLLGTEKSCPTTPNYRTEGNRVQFAPTSTTVEESNGDGILLSNEQANKLTKEEKIRIRKLRKRLAAAAASASAATSDKNASFDNGNKDSDKLFQEQYHYDYRHQQLKKERKKHKNSVRYKMFGKFSCVSCMDALRDCCGVTNDEPTNGVKILRRKDPPVDLQTDLPMLSNNSVVQRLRLILEKLESGQLDTVPAEVLQKNIQYAIEFIQDGEPEKDREPPCQLHQGTTPSPGISSSTGPEGGDNDDDGGGGGDAVSEETSTTAVNNLSHVHHHKTPALQEQEHHPQQQLQKRQSPTTTSCVASSASIITASAAVDSSAEFKFLPQNTNLSSSADTTTLTDITTAVITSTTTTCTTSTIVSSTDHHNVTVDSENNKTIVVATVSSSSSGGDDTNDKNDTTSTPPTTTSTTTTTTSIPTIITPKTDRKSSTSCAASDTLTVPENRRREESDNELSEVDEEVIPEEVRKWLASTFTKTVQPKPRLEPRPRFRSVANAIRVGLFVDRFYRQLSTTTLEIPPDIQALLKEVNNWHFDIFRLHDKSSGHSLKYVGKELFSRYGIVSRFRINLDKLDSYLTAVEFGYTKLKNPYHNDIHAADVTQTLHYFIGSSGLVNMFTDLEIFSLLFAALIHDFEHTGRTNNFHVNVGTELALLYNDRSVLENHHVSAAFRLLRDDDKSILANLKPEEFRDFRNLVIEMVLSTDMSTHFAQIKNVKSILNGEKVSSTTTMSLMSLLLHTADISHPGKPWKMHKKFADTILEEFFLQGDEELKLGLPFSPLCDRNNVLIPESQISFIEFIVEPSLTIMTDLIDFVLNVDDSSGPTPLSAKGDGSSDPKNNSKPVTKPSDNSSNAVSNNSNSSSNDTTAPPPPTTATDSSTSTTSAETTTATNNSDNNSSTPTSSSNNNNNNTTTVSRVPPPVPSRLGQSKSQVKPFQNLSSSSAGFTGTPGRRTESENCIKTAASNTSSGNSSSDAGGKIPLSSRTPSFPLQSGANHNYGPVFRPWINHLMENKAKWRMISAEAAAAANAVQQENS